MQRGASLVGDYLYSFSMNPEISYSAANPGTGYVLASTSPLINGGNPTTTFSGVTAYDINGDPRKYNNTLYSGNLNSALDKVDIGAIEYQGNTIIIPTGTVLEQNYTFPQDMYLFPSRTLTINEGITLSFALSAHAMIYGNLTAIGTCSNP